MPKHRPVARNPFSSRFVVMLGFGGLLALMALAGFDAVEALRRIQSSNDDIRQDFLSRNRALEQIRSDLYLSGTYVRTPAMQKRTGPASSAFGAKWTRRSPPTGAC